MLGDVSNDNDDDVVIGVLIFHFPMTSQVDLPVALFCRLAISPVALVRFNSAVVLAPGSEVVGLG